MNFLGTGLDILIMILGFGLLIFVHELGHFVAAKWAGIRTEAFAIGMGPVIASWRKGVGFALGSTHRKVVAKTGKAAHDLHHDELNEHRIGETEYSLRWVPIGGFVKMLGQEDANPTATSDDPRSYTQCAIGKRMIVVSAGVVMNLILAAVFFVIAFFAGVPFEAPVIGTVHPGTPAATTVASNGESLGISDPGIRPGDRVLVVDGDPVDGFADVHIAAAMAKPGEPITLEVERAGVAEPLRFVITPKKSRHTDLLSIGVESASSTHLISAEDAARVNLDLSGRLERFGLRGVKPGMSVLSVAGAPIEAYEQLNVAAGTSAGRPIATTWGQVDQTTGALIGTPLEIDLPVTPDFLPLRYPAPLYENAVVSEEGLFGLVPLLQITRVESLNKGLLEVGDVMLRAGSLDGPRAATLGAELKRFAGKRIQMVVIRNGRTIDVEAKVSGKGLLQIGIEGALDQTYIGEPMLAVGRLNDDDEIVAETTPVADLELRGRDRVLAVGGTPTQTWAHIRAALKAATAPALQRGDDAAVGMMIQPATPGASPRDVTIQLSLEQVRALHDLGWSPVLPSYVFQPKMMTLKADGVVSALTMGVEKTHEIVLMTYLTIDRLIRGSVGVRQLRGPVGIVHIGTRVVDKGFWFLLFFLAMISVNLAVINFLPLPIVDGGLFLFLIYEKLKGRPPSLAFQNAATVVGLFLIGTILVVVTFYDVVRLFN